MLAQDRRDYELRLKPRMAARLRVEAKDGRSGRYALYLENRGPGIATNIVAELHTGKAGDPGQPLLPPRECSTLRPGDEMEISGVPSPRGVLYVWGDITCRDMEDRPYSFTSPRGSNIWNEASPDPRASD